MPEHVKNIPLQFTNSGLGRIFIGLSWDPREDKVGAIDHIINKDSQHDLDLSCFIYDANGEFLDFVGAEGSECVDETGKIYHSGDNMTGTGGGDDETISAELLKLPEEIHSLVFMVEVGSRHYFADVADPSIRLVDGKTEKALVNLDMNHPETANHAYFVFCCISRNPASSTGWNLKNIQEYPNTDNIEDWGSYLAQYA